MALALVLLLLGTAVLTVGAESAIRGAGRLATGRGISPFVLGALLFGIDVESLGAALIAAGRGQTSIAAGEAFGTIVFLFSAAFGAALIVSRKPIEAPSAQMILLPAAALAVCALALFDSVVTRPEGVALIAVYAMYVNLVIRDSRVVKVAAERIVHEIEEGPRLPPVLLLAGGLVLVYVGASVMVTGGIRILDRTALSAGFVGAAIVGALASADEVLLEVLPVRRGMPELATGNLFGTLVAFSTAVLGLAALIRPLAIDSAAASALIAAAFLYAIVATVFLARGRAGKLTGVAVLLAYASWIVWASGK
jgi:cation:H+ antiporter